MVKSAWLWIAVVLLTVSGCSNHWFWWGSSETGFGEARLYRYDAEPGEGVIALGLECRGNYPDDPSVVLEVTGAGAFSGDAVIALTWDDQKPVEQTWIVKQVRPRIGTTDGSRDAWYWVYPPDQASRQTFMSRLVGSEHLSVEIVGSFRDYVQVPRGQYKTTGTSRVLDDFAKYCAKS